MVVVMVVCWYWFVVFCLLWLCFWWFVGFILVVVCVRDGLCTRCFLALLVVCVCDVGFD